MQNNNTYTPKYENKCKELNVEENMTDCLALDGI